jgi:hypothetical protein
MATQDISNSQILKPYTTQLEENLLNKFGISMKLVKVTNIIKGRCTRYDVSITSQQESQR